STPKWAAVFPMMTAIKRNIPWAFSGCFDNRALTFTFTCDNKGCRRFFFAKHIRFPHLTLLIVARIIQKNISIKLLFSFKNKHRHPIG
ncbi:hypothetical protein, partial [Candidatus Symbiopectobacterium sp. NZEC135]|uniref:hypothetical protein n=1 Tax=Candidatus Symbiopectobacterium sp. NZEC135 TaxID=2820471 RepID=UPI002225D452